MVRRLAMVALVLAALPLGLPLATARAAVPVLVLDGTGWGHGVGLSQWGAEYQARTGRSLEHILGTFYPGAGLGEATGPVRVVVHQPPTNVTTLSFPQGGEIRSPLVGDQHPGFPVQIAPGGRARIRYDGAYRVDGVVTAQSTQRATAYQQDCVLGVVCPTTTQPPTPTTATTAPPSTTAPPAGGGGGGGDGGGGTTTTAPPGSSGAASPAPVWAVPSSGGATTVDDRGRTYRGVIEATGGGLLRLVNVLDVEDYLRGMAEVPGTWPAAAVQAQTIAARTYALRSMRAGGELCDDARCQVYVGRTAESPGQSAAVDATTRRVLTYRGALAAAVYSADAGGVSATPLEGFGTPDGVYPYLTTVRYETDNPLPWHLEVALSDVGRRTGYGGTVTAVRVGRTGPSDRALHVVLEGTAGEQTVDGITFARSLGLRSTRFRVATADADSPPPPPPVTEDTIQALPDQAAAMARRPMRPSRPEMSGFTASLERTFPPALPVATDHRRRLLILAGLLLAATGAGAQLPLALAWFDARPPGARTFAASRLRIRRRSPSRGPSSED